MQTVKTKKSPRGALGRAGAGGVTGRGGEGKRTARWAGRARATMQGMTRRFVIFQLSKYVWGLTAASLIATLVAVLRGDALAIAAAVCVNGGLGYLGYRMTNQYRCVNPACNQLLAFAHGTSSGDGGTTRADICPFCEAPLG